jgi:hypothetical protein
MSLTLRPRQPSFIHWIAGSVRPTYGLDFEEKKPSLYSRIFGNILAKCLIVDESKFVRGQRQGWLQRWDTVARSIFRQLEMCLECAVRLRCVFLQE